ncbi:MAG: arginine--tRNA ligase [Candidatus Pacearchaeota archaeon]|nr:arginine--tRNA ligase [Candidatus Pacearchaeota archaeon]
MEIEEVIKRAVIKAAKPIVLKKDDVMVERPVGKSEKFGDYALPCFDFARRMKKDPKKIAEELADKLNKALPKGIAKAIAVGGYVNFSVDKSAFLQATVEKILAEKEKYGSLQLKGKALIEHTSINPNASPHVGRVRSAIIGDILARLLKFHGYNTEIHYYVNDVSKQIALLLLAAKGNESFDDLLNLYVAMAGRMEAEPELEQKVFEILEKVESKDKETLDKLNKLVKVAVEGQKKILARLGIFYDFFDYESMYLKTNRLKEILKQLEKTKRLKKDVEGRTILDQSRMKWHFENEMKSPILVLTRSDGTGLYPLRDIAYTIDKLKIAPTNIIVLGEDQKLYFKQLSAALELLGYIAPRVVHYSHILLATKKGAKRMATRRGEVVLVSDFIKEAIKKAEAEVRKRKRESKVNLKKVSEAIGIGAVRYSIAKVEQNKSIIFDWQEALNFEGNSAPYLQYSYARASSILKKAGEAKEGEASYENIDDKEYALAREMASFREIAGSALDQLRPHLLCNYSYRLAQTFNDFYESCPVLNAKAGVKERRMLLVRAFKQVLANALNLMGVPLLEAM